MNKEQFLLQRSKLKYLMLHTMTIDDDLEGAYCADFYQQLVPTLTTEQLTDINGLLLAGQTIIWHKRLSCVPALAHELAIKRPLAFDLDSILFIDKFISTIKENVIDTDNMRFFNIKTVYHEFLLNYLRAAPGFKGYDDSGFAHNAIVYLSNPLGAFLGECLTSLAGYGSWTNPVNGQLSSLCFLVPEKGEYTINPNGIIYKKFFVDFDTKKQTSEEQIEHYLDESLYMKTISILASLKSLESGEFNKDL